MDEGCINIYIAISAKFLCRALVHEYGRQAARDVRQSNNGTEGACMERVE